MFSYPVELPSGDQKMLNELIQGQKTVLAFVRHLG